MPEMGLRSLGQGSQIRAWSEQGQAGSRHGVPKTETKVVGGWDTRWKVLEGAWVVGTRRLEFRCCTECNTLSHYFPLIFYHRLYSFNYFYSYSYCDNQQIPMITCCYCNKVWGVAQYNFLSALMWRASACFD